MNKRQKKKFGKVMSEYKAGKLKSGGSGKKVTNPKQAMAIAYAESNSLNQGGMLGDIYSRPMFQTPVQRAGGGIMAGVAPINLEEGGDPVISEDFFSFEKTGEGTGMNLRDVTDLIFDPSDPLDYVTMGLMVFPPAFAAARLAKLGVKGKDLAGQVDKLERAQKIRTAAGRGGIAAGVFEGGRFASEIPELLADDGPRYSDDVMEVSDAIGNIRGIRNLDRDVIRDRLIESYEPEFADQVLAASGFAQGGIASIRKLSGGAFLSLAAQAIKVIKDVGGDWVQRAKDDLARGEITIDEAKDLGLPRADIEDVVSGGRVNLEPPPPLGDMPAPRMRPEDLGLDPSGQFPPKPKTPFDDLEIDLEPLPPTPPATSAAAVPAARAAGEAVEEVVEQGATGGRGIGRGAAIGGAGLVGAGLIGGALLDDEEQAPPVVLQPDPEETGTGGGGDGDEKGIGIFEKIGSFLSDPRNQAGLINMGKRREGFVPQSGLTRFLEGQQEYDLRQDKDRTALQSNFEYLRGMLGKETSDADILEMLLKPRKATAKTPETFEEYLAMLRAAKLESDFPAALTKDDIEDAKVAWERYLELKKESAST